MTTQADKQERISFASTLLLGAYAYMNVVTCLMQQFQVTERTAKSYIEEARASFSQNAVSLQGDAYVDYARTESLYQKSFESGETQVALKVVETRQKIRKELLQYEFAQKLPEADLPPELQRIYDEACGGG
jgi:hypothetical protein